MDRTIIGLGFERRDFDRPCTEFSGGWRMRIELAKILLSHPDLLLLDEPTNHLDIESIQWLEDFLKASQSAVLMVSHDRAFIDNVCNRTIEITLGRIYDYNVNYSRFVELRKERHEQQVRAYPVTFATLPTPGRAVAPRPPSHSLPFTKSHTTGT